MRWIKRAFEIPIHLLAVQWFWLGAARLAFIPLCMLATFSLGGAGMLLGTLVGALLGAPSHHLHLLSWPVALLLLCVPICWGICQRQGASSGLARMLLHLFAAAWMLWGMQLAHSQLSFVSPALSPC